MSDTSGSSVFPGYREVESFGPDEEYEDEEEVCFVTLDMGSIDPTLVPSISSYRLIGLDTPTPFAQLGGSIFKGRHQDLLGTELLFTDADNEPGQRGVQYVGSSERRVCFKEVQLKPRQDQQSAGGEAGASSNVPKRTVESVTKRVGRPRGRPKGTTRAGKGRQEVNAPEAQPADPVEERSGYREEEAMEVDS